MYVLTDDYFKKRFAFLLILPKLTVFIKTVSFSKYIKAALQHFLNKKGPIPN